MAPEIIIFMIFLFVVAGLIGTFYYVRHLFKSQAREDYEDKGG